MAKKTKVKFTKNRNPIIVLVCEGRNKTESKYYGHFIKRENLYNLKKFLHLDEIYVNYRNLKQN